MTTARVILEALEGGPLAGRLLRKTTGIPAEELYEALADLRSRGEVVTEARTCRYYRRAGEADPPAAVRYLRPPAALECDGCRELRGRRVEVLHCRACDAAAFVGVEDLEESGNA